jgi:hypothetical protein
VQVFRRPASLQDSASLKLHGLDADASYTVTDVDTSNNTVGTGRALMNVGLGVVLHERPGSSILVYKKKG